MLKWAGNNPVLVGVIILFGVGFLGAYPLPAVFVLAVVAGGVGFWRWMIRLDKRSWEHIHQRQALIAHADYEHWLIMNGDDRGIYGGYPPYNAENVPAPSEEGCGDKVGLRAVVCSARLRR